MAGDCCGLIVGLLVIVVGRSAGDNCGSWWCWPVVGWVGGGEKEATNTHISFCGEESIVTNVIMNLLLQAI